MMMFCWVQTKIRKKCRLAVWIELSLERHYVSLIDDDVLLGTDQNNEEVQCRLAVWIGFSLERHHVSHSCIWC